MPRGRPPTKGLEDALPLARARGRVMQFVQQEECAAELLVIMDGEIVFIRIRRSVRIRKTLPDIEAEFREPVDMLRTIPDREHVLREFWLYSKYGTWRYFRIEETGLVEIDCNGKPLNPPAP